MNRLLVVFLVCAPFFGMQAQRPDSTFWAPNGHVNSITLKDSILFLGGSFDHISPVTGSFVRLDTSTALPDPAMFKVNGTVHAMTRDADGYVYVGGNFSWVGNQSASNLFRLTPAGIFDNSFLHTVDGPVYALTVFKDTLYIGGDFAIVDGDIRHSAASLDIDDGSLTSFDPNVDGAVYCMCPEKSFDPMFDRMILGGNFFGVGIFTPPHLAKVDLVLGLPVTFNAVPWSASPNANGPVFDIEICGSEIYIAGEFTSFGNIQRKGMATIGLGSGLLKAKDPGINAPVYCMERLGTQLYIGGSFSIVDGSFRDRLACVDTSMNVGVWDPGADGRV
ncbi:MAG TPA: delta-60 repeat domain-containing protein, partial [Bacteroidia bacterium]|nr:delta-60 repeat domain-containing protein [Bacteroidia bacterium]